jgi:DNA polymerase-3 subunit epsilon
MNSDRPLVFFDLEATGISALDDKIVDICLLKKFPDGKEELFSSLVNPGVPIPREAVAIHHITDEMVATAPTIKDLAIKILDFIEGADIGGFNILKYDLPMLTAELKRAGFELKLEGRRLVDAFTIFQKMEPRNLGAAYKFYCGKVMDSAHRAEVDTRASLAVFEAQAARYEALPKDMAGIASFCSSRDAKAVDAEGKFVWRNGEAAFNFGKHRTLTLREVAARDRSYIEWLMRAERTTPELARICKDALEGKFPKPASAGA